MDTLIRNIGTIASGDIARPLLDADSILIRDGHIAVIDRGLDGEADTVIDARGTTVMPGLIDSHVHLNFSAGPDHETVRQTLDAESEVELMARSIGNAQAHLRGGVTTVRDCGGRGLSPLAVRDAIRSGLVLGPRVIAAGPAKIACAASAVARWAATLPSGREGAFSLRPDQMPTRSLPPSTCSIRSCTAQSGQGVGASSWSEPTLASTPANAS